MSIVYHVTTQKKLERFNRSGCILPPVRYWTTLYSALRWARRTGRLIILEFEEPLISYPLPQKGGTKWSPEIIREWKIKWQWEIGVNPFELFKLTN